MAMAAMMVKSHIKPMMTPGEVDSAILLVSDQPAAQVSIDQIATLYGDRKLKVMDEKFVRENSSH